MHSKGKADPLGRLVVGDGITAPSETTENSRESDVETAMIADSDDLAEFVEPIERAKSFAQRWDAPYRAEIFRIALGALLNSDRGVAPRQAETASRRTGKATSYAGTQNSDADSQSGAIEKLARLLNVDADEVSRTVAIGEGGKVTILARIAGSTKKELQTDYSLIYLYVCEMGLGKRLVDIEELRKLCVEQGCYDLNNFTANFRKDVQAALLREQGEKGSRTRRYLLSQKGIATAAELLRKLTAQ